MNIALDVNRVHLRITACKRLGEVIAVQLPAIVIQCILQLHVKQRRHTT